MALTQPASPLWRFFWPIPLADFKKAVARQVSTASGDSSPIPQRNRLLIAQDQFQSLWRFFGRFHTTAASERMALPEVSIALAILRPIPPRRSNVPTGHWRPRRFQPLWRFFGRFHIRPKGWSRLRGMFVSIALAILRRFHLLALFGSGLEDCFNRSGDSFGFHAPAPGTNR